MKNFFDTENKFWRLFGSFADVLVLSLLWAICCLPVVTIGAASIALYDAAAKRIHEDEGHPYKHFFHVLRTELLRGIGITVLWGLLAFLLTLGYSFLYQQGKTNSLAAMYSMVYLGSLLIPVSIFLWLLPVEARFAHGFWSLHKTAASFAFVHLPTTALLLVILVGCVILAGFLPVLIFFLPSIMVMLQSTLVEKVFKKYIEEEPNDTSV